MARTKKRGAAQGTTVQPKKQKSDPRIVQQWNAYFGPGDLEDWQRLMRDLGFQKEFQSKRSCRKLSTQLIYHCKALKKVWINIVDFLAAIGHGNAVYRFNSQHELSHYTLNTGKIYPRRWVTEGSPLRALFAHIRDPWIAERKVSKKEMDEITNGLGDMKIVGHGY
ncbi:hypothetical protein SCUP515_04521 [Seiridium cupressi]